MARLGGKAAALALPTCCPREVSTMGLAGKA